MSSDGRGTPFAPHTPAETAAMLDAVGADSEEDLFDIPEPVRFDGEFGIDARDERTVRREVGAMLNRNETLTEFLGRGHYEHYVPSVVNNLSARSEFLTSYTQYQPEVAQGFLQALFEYQSLLVELTGLDIANCSMYDAATALGEAATLAARVRQATGETVLVPDYVREERVDVLRNYVDGIGIQVERVETEKGNVDPDALGEAVDDDTVMVYVENPTTYGTIEEHLDAVGDITDDNDALFCLGSDPVALSLLQRPADVGADVVIGEAATLGLGAGYGMGMGLFACREEFLRQTPGRLVGVSEDQDDRRAYTLTLQTREQHIRRERATSNICTNQAWVALRTAMHAFWLGPDGLVDLANECVEGAESLAARIDDIAGYRAPVFDRHHFREFLVRTDQPARAIAADLRKKGFAVHVVDTHLLQLCTTEANANKRDALVAAMREVA